MLWQIAKSIVLFWFSSVSLIFIAMVLLFLVSYLYDCYVWSTTPSALRIPQPISNPSARGESVVANSRTTPLGETAHTSKKGAKWKKSSKKSSDKREKEIQSTDYESSHESLTILDHQRRIDEFLALTKHLNSENNAANTANGRRNDRFTRYDQKDVDNYEDSDESFLETAKFKLDKLMERSGREEIYSPSSFIPLSNVPPKSSQCFKRSLNTNTIDHYKDITPTSDNKKVSGVSPSPYIALSGPGPGSFVANRAEPIITPSAYVDPPIYGNVRPIFHGEGLPSKSSCTECQAALRDEAEIEQD